MVSKSVLAIISICIIIISSSIIIYYFSPSVNLSVIKTHSSLFDIDGVVAVKSKTLPSPHIVVGVTDLAVKSRIPAQIDGFPVKVILQERPSLLGVPSVSELRKTRLPLMSGIQIETEVSFYSARQCTLGAIVIDGSTNMPVILTADHCITETQPSDYNDIGNKVTQGDGLIGGVYKISPDGGLTDTALINPFFITTLCPSRKCLTTETFLGEHIVGFGTVTENMKVWKIGRTTGYTEGTVTSALVYYETKQRPGFKIKGFEITGDGNSKFGDEGDSGSAIITKSKPYRIVGIASCGSSNKLYSNLPEDIQSKMGIHIETIGSQINEPLLIQEKDPQTHVSGNIITVTVFLKNMGTQMNDKWLLELQPRSGSPLSFIGSQEVCDPSNPVNVHKKFTLGAGESGVITLTSTVPSSGKYDLYLLSMDSCCTNNPACKNKLPYGWGKGIGSVSVTVQTCGNNICDSGESCSNCPRDCGSCPPSCGNSLCETGETCSNCPVDCGKCQRICGNSVCEAGETCLNCPSDCSCPSHLVCMNEKCSEVGKPSPPPRQTTNTVNLIILFGVIVVISFVGVALFRRRK